VVVVTLKVAAWLSLPCAHQSRSLVALPKPCRHGCSAADKLFYDIQEVMLHALFCVQKQMLNDPHCFELYGYDILIDSSLKPWCVLYCVHDGGGAGR